MEFQFLLCLLFASVLYSSYGENTVPEKEDVSPEDAKLPGDENQIPKVSLDDDFQGNYHDLVNQYFLDLWILSPLCLKKEHLMQYNT